MKQDPGFNLEKFVDDNHFDINTLPVVLTPDKIRAFVIAVASKAAKEVLETLTVTIVRGDAEHPEGRIVIESQFHVRRFPAGRALTHMAGKVRGPILKGLRYQKPERKPKAKGAKGKPELRVVA